MKFTLTHLLLAISAVVILCGWFLDQQDLRDRLSKQSAQLQKVREQNWRLKNQSHDLRQSCFKFQNLSWHGREITTPEIQTLYQFTQIRRLNLSGSKINSEKLENIAKLDFIRSLHLGHNPGIDDEGLELLHTMTRLVELELHQCPNITDQGVERLAAITDLRRLRLGDRFRDSPAVDRLKTSRPACKVVFDNQGEIRWFGMPR